MRILAAPLVLISLFVLLLSCQSSGDMDVKYKSRERPAGKEGEILVKYRPDVSGKEKESIMNRMETEILQDMGSNLYLLRIPKGESVEGMVEKFSALFQVTHRHSHSPRSQGAASERARLSQSYQPVCLHWTHSAASSAFSKVASHIPPIQSLNMPEHCSSCSMENVPVVVL